MMTDDSSVSCVRTTPAPPCHGNNSSTRQVHALSCSSLQPKRKTRLTCREAKAVLLSTICKPVCNAELPPAGAAAAAAAAIAILPPAKLVADATSCLEVFAVHGYLQRCLQLVRIHTRQRRTIWTGFALVSLCTPLVLVTHERRL
jgi:hypothetical protein